VRLGLIDIDGLHDPGILLPDDAAEEAECAHSQPRAERACGYAEEVSPLITEGDSPFANPTAARPADDLARTISRPGLLVSEC
jgi:hypothetical protein